MRVHAGSVRSAGAAAAIACSVLLWHMTPALLQAQPSKQHARACDSLECDFAADAFSFIDLNDLLPSVISDQIRLKRYIRDPRFMDIRFLCSDTAAVDAIFLRSMAIADGDTRYALLIALLGSMDHFNLGIKIPLLGVLWIPLTTESDSVFRMRYSHLPRKVLPDSVGRTERDKDKLQHFFGSAYIAYLTNSGALANIFGNLIEEGEDAFVVGGVNDERDKLANRLGQEFGLRLLNEDEVLPSDVLWKPGR